MPFADNNGVKIYYEVEGTGPPLVLMHGVAMRGDTWRLGGYVEPLCENNQLVLIDARGHGQSDKPHEQSEYSAVKRSGDVCAVLDSLGHSEAHYLGISMGGQIGFDLCLVAPHRFTSFMIGGAALIPPDPNFSFITRERIEGLAENALKRDYLSEEVNQKHSAYLLENDVEAFKAARLATVERDLTVYRTALAGLEQPILFYAGTNDPADDAARDTAAMCRNGRFESIRGLDHVESFFKVDQVLPVISSFLAETG